MARNVPDRTELFRILEIMEARRRSHHGALWEEQKHFSWWLAPIPPLIVGAHLSDRLNEAAKAGLMLGGSVVGIVVALAAIVVIWREGKFFRETLLAVNRAGHGLGLDNQETYAPLIGRPLPLIPEHPLDEKCLRLGIVQRIFMCLFGVAILGFLALAVWALRAHGPLG